MIGLAHHVLVALHARGLHPAVLAGLVMMPAVVAVGFWTDEATQTAALPALSDLRGSLAEPATVASGDRLRNGEVPKALPME